MININTAPKMVLRSLCDEITPELADKLDEYRTKEGNDLSGSQWYKQVPGMADITIKPELITVKSNYFKIISTGNMNNMAKTLSGIVQRSTKNPSRSLNGGRINAANRIRSGYRPRHD